MHDIKVETKLPNPFKLFLLLVSQLEQVRYCFHNFYKSLEDIDSGQQQQQNCRGQRCLQVPRTAWT